MSDNYRVNSCSKCESLCDSRNQIVNGVGPNNASIVFVGEAPGANEDENGEPFVGQSGTILDEALEKNDVNRSEVRITNCVRCRPPDNRDPYVSELSNCEGYLAEELTSVSPEVVVTLGRVPTEQLVDVSESVTEAAGTCYDGSIGDWSGNVVVSVHPAATLYQRNLRPTFETAIETAVDFAF